MHQGLEETAPSALLPASLPLHPRGGGGGRGSTGSTPRWLPFVGTASTQKVPRGPGPAHEKSASLTPHHLPRVATSVVAKTQQMVFLSTLPSWGVGKLKISDAFQKAHRMPPPVFHMVHLLPLIYGEAPPGRGNHTLTPAF